MLFRSSSAARSLSLCCEPKEGGQLRQADTGRGAGFAGQRLAGSPGTGLCAGEPSW